MKGVTFVCLNASCRRAWWQAHLDALVCIYCGSSSVRPKTPFTDGEDAHV